MNSKTGKTLTVMTLFVIGFAVWGYTQSGEMPNADPVDLWEHITETPPL
ncbi:MAG: hypothetical protein ACQES5_11585 [Thermodesulfobacteriota bacterium]